MKSKTTAYLLWFFLGAFGAHKFYLNKTGTGILYLFTLGIFGFGVLIDLFTLGGQVDTYNALFGRQFGQGNVNTNHIVVNVPGHQIPQTPLVSDQLQRLHELKEKGILSLEEFETQKIKLLA